MVDQEVGTDVLVIGGGSAGTMAAAAARRRGVRVALVDKAGIDRSGCACAGNDHFLAVLESGPRWDTREAFLEWYVRLTHGLIDPVLVERLYLARIGNMVRQLERLGIPMRLDREHNDYIRTKSFAQPGAYYINFDGRNIKPVISAQAAESGVGFFRRIAVTGLLSSGGAVVGACGFDIRNGDFYTFRAKATVLATGNATRLYDNQVGMPYNSWHSPYNTGAAQALAFRAGAAVVNMEFVNYTVTPANFSASALNAVVGMGGYIINALGQRFLFKYHEQGELGPRWVMPWGVYWEIKEGRGPCYFDLRHLPEEALGHLVRNLLPVDKNTFLDYCEQKHLDLHRDLMEVQISEGQLPAFLGSVSGIRVNERGATNVAGLYAAGGCSVTIGSLAGSMCVGEAVGEEAAGFALSLAPSPPAVEEAGRKGEREKIYRPLTRKGGVTHHQLEEELRRVMSAYVGIGRTEAGLKQASAELDRLERLGEELSAGDGHELMRVHEARELLTVARLITRGALYRQESRFGLSHYRTDYPHTVPAWRRSVAQTLADGEVEVSSLPPYN